MAAQIQRREFKPLPKQREFMESTAPEILYSGAFGAGKSRVGCEKGHFLSVRFPGNVGLVCRKVFADLPSTTLWTLFNEVIPEDHIVRQNKSEHWLDVRTIDPTRTSRIYYRGLDRPAGIGSMNLGWVFYDEAIEGEEEDWAMLEGRLRLNTVPFRQIFSATNPGAPSHWLHERFYPELHGKPMLVDERGRRIRHVIETDAFSNPHNPPDYIARINRLTGVHLLRYGKGQWVGAEGLVYPQFDPRKHIIEPFPIPKDWPRWRVFDLGTANPFVCQWWAMHPAKRQYIMYREIYMSGRRIEEHAPQVVKLSQGEAYQANISDHDLGERLTLKAHGIPTIAANKDVGVGIQVMSELLADNPVTAEPSMVFFRDALVEVDPVLESSKEKKPVCTVGEFGSYKWAKGAHGTIRDEPQKKNDHGMDAARYFAMHVAPPEADDFSFGSVSRR